MRLRMNPSIDKLNNELYTNIKNLYYQSDMFYSKENNGLVEIASKTIGESLGGIVPNSSGSASLNINETTYSTSLQVSGASLTDTLIAAIASGITDHIAKHYNISLKTTSDIETGLRTDVPSLLSYITAIDSKLTTLCTALTAAGTSAGPAFIPGAALAAITIAGTIQIPIPITNNYVYSSSW